MSTAGLQLSLALANLVEASLWQDIRRLPLGDGVDREAQTAGYELCHRSMAETATSYLVSVGHACINVAARALVLHPEVLKAAKSRGLSFDPQSNEREAWLSLERIDFKKLRVAHREAPADIVGGDILAPIGALLADALWTKLIGQRAEHWHRHWPQVDGLIDLPSSGPWTTHQDGSASMTLGTDAVERNGLADSMTELVQSCAVTLAAQMDLLDKAVARRIYEVSNHFC